MSADGPPGADAEGLPAELFQRADESPDGFFYVSPRFITHIDDATISALTEFYREFIPADADVLDLMSSWISHLPTDRQFGRVVGLGMNTAELERNPQLSEHVVQDLNRDPQLPYGAASFDRVTIAVSIQYLTRPVDVLRSVRESLRPAGRICIAMSHRLFPTKAIAAFQRLAPQERVELVTTYLQMGGFRDVEFIDRSPPHADPLWLVVGSA